MLIAKV